MARIAGVELPRERIIEAALTKIFGIGWTTAKQIVSQVDIDPSKRISELTEDEIGRLRAVVENQFKVEGDLHREIQLDIKRLMDINCYRGTRHRRNLPVRGQRTSTNARTRRGGYKAKRTITVGRKSKEVARKGGG
ncbi:MAG: small subunit ribosomal protein [Candidatus Poribacteria bacterium]|nr:small subunit ribosomal protein [Candidatus Poribacteria bacterium]MDQ1326868.1 small subunit ribosomal protein [Candidatus Poribacteria bacterium]